MAEGKLRVYAPQLEVAPRNAGARLVDGEVITTPSSVGKTLDIYESAAWLEQHVDEVLSSDQLPLVMTEIEPALTDVTPFVDEVLALMERSLGVTFYDPIADEHLDWKIQPNDIGGWLTLSPDPLDPAKLSWSFDQNAVAESVKAQSNTLEPERYLKSDEIVKGLVDAFLAGGGETHARVWHHPREHVVQSGETLSSIADDYGIPYPWIQAANPELGDSLMAGKSIIIPSQDNLLPLTPIENKRIDISITKQAMVAYEDGKVKWEWPVSTGMAESPTSPGIFQVQSHEPNAYAELWDLWMPHFMGIYRPVPSADFMNGFHGFPSRGGSQILWERNIGHPITYGCILLDTDNAKLLYDWAEEGVVVHITP